MAGSDDIVIVYAFLDTLASNAQHSADMLDDSSEAMQLSFTGNRDVENAYEDFLGKWDKHRGDLREGVAAAAQAFAAVSQAFKDCEEQLIAALDGE